MKNTNTKTMTLKEIIETIPARLGLTAEQLDLSTPQKAFEFLADEDNQIFAKSAGEQDAWGNGNCSSVLLETGYKVMYDMNNLFADTSEKREEMQKKYNVYPNWTAEYAVDDATGCVETGSYTEENLHYISDEGWPYVIGFDPIGQFNELVDAVRKICAANREWAKITAFISDEQYVICVSEDGTVTNENAFEIEDDNSYCFAYDLLHYLEVYRCDSFEETEQYGPVIAYIESNEKINLPSNSGMAYVYAHKEEISKITDADAAAELVHKYPRAILALPEDMQRSKKTAYAFVDANAQYMQELFAIYCQFPYYERFSKDILQKEASVFLNGVCQVYFSPLKTNVLHEWIVKEWYKNDLELLEKMIAGKMHYFVELDDALFEQINHIDMLKKYPWYSSVVANYFTAAFENQKLPSLQEHVKRRFGLSNDVSEAELAAMAAYEMIEKTGEDSAIQYAVTCKTISSAELMAPLLSRMSKVQRDILIKKNNFLIYSIADTLENDEEIVDCVCEHCPHAGDLLSDEIVLKRGLKRSTLHVEEICERCFLC